MGRAVNLIFRRGWLRPRRCTVLHPDTVARLPRTVQPVDTLRCATRWRVAAHLAQGESAIRRIGCQRFAVLVSGVTCAVAVFCVGAPRLARASDAAVAQAQTVPRAWGLAFAAGVPGLLDPGLGTGLGLSVQVGPRRRLAAWQVSSGLELLWLTSGGDTANWRVDHDEARLQVHVDARLRRGKGAWLVRAGVGATAVLEQRVRHQSERLGSGAIRESATAILPIFSLAIDS